MRNTHLVLCKFPQRLTAAVVKRVRGKNSILALFREEVMDSEPLEDNLIRLKKRCHAYAALWNKPVFINLPARDAVFKNFILPPARKKQAEKSVRLMLDGECPFDLDEYVTDIYFSKSSISKSLNGLVTIISNKLLANWNNALKKVEVPEAILEIRPWPCIQALPHRRKKTLLLVLEEAGGSMSAMTGEGKTLWIRQLMPSGNMEPRPLAEQLIHQYELAAGSGWHAEELLVLNLSHLQDIKEALFLASGLPVYLLGDEIPLGGGYNRISENEPERLLAMASVHPRLPWHKTPAFILHPYIGNKNTDWRKFAIPAGAVSVLLLFVFSSIALDARARFEAAENLQEKLTAQLRKTLGDAPKNASSGRLQAILNSRLKSLQMEPAQGYADTMLGRLNYIHQVVPPELKIDLRRLNFADGHIRLYGQSANFSDVNTLKEVLDKLPCFANCRIVNASARSDNRNNRNSTVDFEIDLALSAQND